MVTVPMPPWPKVGGKGCVGTRKEVLVEKQPKKLEGFIDIYIFTDLQYIIFEFTHSLMYL